MLEVGPKRIILNGREDVFNKIPYFESAITNNTLELGIPFPMPHHNARAVSDVLKFISDGEVEPLPVPQQPRTPSSSRPEDHAKAHRYIEAYIAAHQLDAEGLQNIIVDALTIFYMNNLIQPDAVLLLTKAEMR